MKTPIEQYVIDKVREKRLAYCLGVSRGFIGDVENPNQRAKYNLNHINELSIIFNCPFSDFFPSTPFPSSKEL